jgi:hypothetical protein
MRVRSCRGTPARAAVPTPSRQPPCVRRVKGLGLRVEGLGCRVLGSWLRIQGLGFRIHDLGRAKG